MRGRLVVAVLSILAGTAGAAEIQGKVVQIDRDTVSVSVEGKLEPEVGAKVKIYHLIPGLDEPASVATGEVSGVKDGVVLVKVLTKTSAVRKGHRATILAENPRKSGEGEPEPKPPTDPLDLTGEWKITFTPKTAFGSAFTDTGKFRLEKTAPSNFMIPGGNFRSRVRIVEKELWFYNEAGGKGSTASINVDAKSGIIQLIEWDDGSVFRRKAEPVVEPKTGKVTGFRDRLTLSGHEGTVTSVAYSPDGKWLASGSYDKSVKVWDAKTGQVTHTLKKHDDAVNSVAFSPDSKRLASAGCKDGSAIVWDVLVGGSALIIHSPKDVESALSVAYNPNGKQLAVGHGHSVVTVWDADTGKHIWTGEKDKDSNIRVAFTPDGKRLASATGMRTVLLTDADTGKSTWTYKDDTLATCFDFSPDRETIAVGSLDSHVQVWEADTGKRILNLKASEKGAITCVAYSPDSQIIAAGTEANTIKIWNASSGKEITTISWDKGEPTRSVAFSPDGKLLAFTRENTVSIWEATTGNKPGQGNTGTKEPPPTDLDPRLIEAWTKAGAKFGWYALRNNRWEFSETKVKDVPVLPGFIWSRLEPGVIAKLPAPATAFGVGYGKEQMTDTVMKELGGLHSLRVLELSSCGGVSGAGLKELAGLKDLQYLGLSYSGVTAADLKKLASLERLQFLSLAGANLTDEGLKELARFKSLQFLWLDSSKVTDTGLKELAVLKSLKGLSLDRCFDVTGAGLKELARLENLQELNLEACHGITDAGLMELAGFKNLQILNLRSMSKLTGAGLKGLVSLQRLQTLHLESDEEVKDAGLKELAGLKNLQYLFLDYTRVTDTGMRELAGLQRLQTLSLHNNLVTDSGLKELAGLKNLQSLNLGATRVTDAGLKELAGLQSLKALNLYDTGVTDAGLKELAGLTSLQILNLESTKVTDKGLTELRKALPKCKIIREAKNEK